MAYEQAIVLVFAVVSGGVSSQQENRPFAGGQSRVKKNRVKMPETHLGVSSKELMPSLG